MAGRANPAYYRDSDHVTVDEETLPPEGATTEQIDGGRKNTFIQNHVKLSVFICFVALVTTLVVTVIVFLPVYILVIEPRLNVEKQDPVSIEEALKNSEWGYIDVRPGAHMFWWLYFARSENQQKPLFIWIQGGPGQSGTGLGNMLEMGPFDENLIPRKTSWVYYANVLYTDQPVGTGYSYVDHTTLLTNTTEQIVQDLLVLVRQILLRYPQFQKVPVYLFGESYGGKIAPLLAKAMHQDISTNKMTCQLVEIVLGGPAVHMLDIISTYGDFLYTVSLMDTNQKNHFNNVVFKEFETAFLANSSNITSQLESIFRQMPENVDNFNFLAWDKRDKKVESLPELMNGKMKQGLSVIPEQVTWSEVSRSVYRKEQPNMPVPVSDVVDYILKSTNINVTVYVGQLDIIVNSIGTEKWLTRLTWPGISNFNSSNRTRLSPGPNPQGFIKVYDKFSFYWILDSGHEVPADNGYAAELMIRHILGL